ncbi:UNVERIFIED_CONTAM: hypothetical protein K2H54_058330 [Gekko kuhli]
MDLVNLKDKLVELRTEKQLTAFSTSVLINEEMEVICDSSTIALPMQTPVDQDVEKPEVQRTLLFYEDPVIIEPGSPNKDLEVAAEPLPKRSRNGSVFLDKKKST